MALDPAIFEAEEERLGVKFPARGTPILARNRDGNVVAGNVGAVWLALDMVCIEIETINGQAKIYPERGDEFRTWDT
jgi:hypothetical protein